MEDEKNSSYGINSNSFWSKEFEEDYNKVRNLPKEILVKEFKGHIKQYFKLVNSGKHFSSDKKYFLSQESIFYEICLSFLKERDIQGLSIFPDRIERWLN